MGEFLAAVNLLICGFIAFMFAVLVRLALMIYKSLNTPIGIYKSNNVIDLEFEEND